MESLLRDTALLCNSPTSLWRHWKGCTSLATASLRNSQITIAIYWWKRGGLFSFFLNTANDAPGEQGQGLRKANLFYFQELNFHLLNTDVMCDTALHPIICHERQSGLWVPRRYSPVPLFAAKSNLSASQFDPPQDKELSKRQVSVNRSLVANGWHMHNVTMEQHSPWLHGFHSLSHMYFQSLLSGCAKQEMHKAHSESIESPCLDCKIRFFVL